MDASVIYHSQFGNTRQIAEAIVEVFQGAGTARMLSADQLVATELQDFDLVVMGAPTHKMNLPEAVRPVFDDLPRCVLRGVAVAAFDTSYEMSAFLARFTAAKRIDRQLRKLGGRRLVPSETFYVHRHHEGPLLDGEIERAKEWAEAILAEYRRVSEREQARRR
ncbi:MAG: flavodoxin family protein [Anaerolineae bacterium]|jgi:flavodoxin